MQIALSRIWTQIAVFISYNGNNFTTNASTMIYVIIIKVCDGTESL